MYALPALIPHFKDSHHGHFADSSNVVALTFKDRPPRIPESFLQVISAQSDETRDSTSESRLLEFHPGYTRHSSCSDDADVAGATLSSKIASPGVQIEPVGSPECPTNDLSSRATTQEINESVSISDTADKSTKSW